MVAGQKASINGIQQMLFPLSYMYITQGEDGSYSHQGTYAIDFQGYDENGRVYECPYYAPFDCHCVAIWGSTSPMIVWQSDNPVWCVDGTTDYMCIGFCHDDDIPNFRVGDTRSQGDIIGHTGTYGNVTGDHCHMEVSKGLYAGYYQNSQGVWQLRQEYHIYNACGINNTNIVVDLGYPWSEFNIIPPRPMISAKGHFPWVLYMNKLRSVN